MFSRKSLVSEIIFMANYQACAPLLQVFNNLHFNIFLYVKY